MGTLSAGPRKFRVTTLSCDGGGSGKGRGEALYQECKTEGSSNDLKSSVRRPFFSLGEELHREISYLDEGAAPWYHRGSCGHLGSKDGDKTSMFRMK